MAIQPPTYTPSTMTPVPPPENSIEPVPPPAPEPTEPIDTTTPDRPVEIPKTGDNGTEMILLVGMIAIIAVISLAAVKKRRK